MKCACALDTSHSKGSDTQTIHHPQKKLDHRALNRCIKQRGIIDYQPNIGCPERKKLFFASKKCGWSYPKQETIPKQKTATKGINDPAQKCEQTSSMHLPRLNRTIKCKGNNASKVSDRQNTRRHSSHPLPCLMLTLSFNISK